MNASREPYGGGAGAGSRPYTQRVEAIERANELLQRYARLALAELPSGTPIFDAQKMCVVPGFIDCHNHTEAETLLYGVLVGNPFEVEFVTVENIQVHGAVGFTCESDAQFFYKRAKQNDTLLGYQGWQRKRIADLVLDAS